jgi:hypothetical protein
MQSWFKDRRSALHLTFAGLACFAAVALATKAHAINYGQPDTDNVYPWVGLMYAAAPGASSGIVCSGSMISPDVFVTAAHCVTDPSLVYSVSVQPGPSFSGTFVAASYVATAPGWTGAFTVPDTRDIGVIVLSQPIHLPSYGQLPPIGLVEQLLERRGTQDRRFVAVGYGLQRSHPIYTEWDLRRWYGEQRLVQMSSAYTDGYNIMLTNNPGLGSGSGGTCSGDSGGPIVHAATGYIVAVNSFGVAPYCKGNDYAYRIDRRFARDFIASHSDEAQ